MKKTKIFLSGYLLGLSLVLSACPTKKSPHSQEPLSPQKKTSYLRFNKNSIIEFLKSSHTTPDHNKLPSPIIFGISTDDDGVLIATDQGAAYSEDYFKTWTHFDETGSTFYDPELSPVNTAPNQKFTLGKNKVNSVFLFGKRKIFTLDNAITYTSKKLKKNFTINDFPVNTAFTYSSSDSTHVYLGTSKNSIIHFVEKNDTVKKLLDINLRDSSFPPDNEITQLYQVRHQGADYLAVGTSNGFTFVDLPNNDQSIPAFAKGEKITGFAQVNKLFAATTNNLWELEDINKPLVPAAQGLFQGKYVTGIAARKNFVVVTVYKEGAYLSEDGGKTFPIHLEKEKLGSLLVTSVAMTDRAIFIGTFNQGVVMILDYIEEVEHL